jgi:hypothetical protein
MATAPIVAVKPFEKFCGTFICGVVSARISLMADGSVSLPAHLPRLEIGSSPSGTAQYGVPTVNDDKIIAVCETTGKLPDGLRRIERHSLRLQILRNAIQSADVVSASDNNSGPPVAGAGPAIWICFMANSEKLSDNYRICESALRVSRPGIQNNGGSSVSSLGCFCRTVMFYVLATRVAAGRQDQRMHWEVQ